MVVEGKKWLIEKQICEALGLDNVVSLELRFAINEVATAKVTYFPDGAELEKAAPIIKEFKLIPKKENDDGTKT